MDTYLMVDILAGWLATIIKTFFWNEICIIMPWGGGRPFSSGLRNFSALGKPQNSECTDCVGKGCPLVSTRGQPSPPAIPCTAAVWNLSECRMAKFSMNNKPTLFQIKSVYHWAKFLWQMIEPLQEKLLSFFPPSIKKIHVCRENKL